MADDVTMVVVDGVRYRPEDAPKKAETVDQVDAKQATPANKSRTPENKEK